MVFLDTHALLLFHQGDRSLLSEQAISLFDEADALLISPIVLLETQYLKEIGRIRFSADTVFQQMSALYELQLEEKGFAQAIWKALEYSWTRDPFDRVITAHASLFEAVLLTKDQLIQQHYPRAVW